MDGIVDDAVLRQLADDVGRDAARSFAECYCAMLENRVARLVHSVRCGDAEEAYVAALSLHSSSAMVGAKALAAHAEGCATALRSCQVAAARTALRELRELASQTATVLARTMGDAA